jgi:hypothetical protein
MHDQIIYRERLWPGLAFPSFLVFMGASLAVAYQRAYHGNVGMVTLVISVLVTVAVTYAVSPQVIITSESLTAGKASIPRKYIGKIAILNVQESKHALGKAAYGNALTVTRAAIKNSVVIEVLDELDPHPYWQISTRNPQDLVKALQS